MAEPILTLDKYNLLEVLGRGGMATVYKARMNGPMGFEKLAAVKLLHTELGSDKDVVGMFIGEARVGANLSHPNVIGILDFGMIDNRYYLAMEYVDGCSLANLVKPGAAAGKPMPIEAAVCAIIDALDGLAYVHTARDPNGSPLGIVHRDISPQNIMVGRDGRARIGDFGIATGDFRDSFTHAGVVKGKVAYMSPEQAAGRPLDARSDIAATGLTLFALISGRVPFQGTDTMAVLASAEQGLKAEALDQIRCPPALKDVILKATAPRMQDRFQKAAEFKAALEASTTGWDDLGRSLLQKMVAAATRARKSGPGRTQKTPPLSAPLKKARARLTTRNSSVAAEPVTRLTLLTYRVATSLVVSAMILAVILAMIG